MKYYVRLGYWGRSRQRISWLRYWWYRLVTDYVVEREKNE